MRRTLAIVGLGAAAREIHLPAYARLGDLEVAGGFDPAARPGEFPFPLFASAEEMLERTRPDILAVATPPESHFSLARLGLMAGCHVFCEKPFMPTLEEAQGICAMAQKAGRWVVVNNQYRFMRIHEEARRRIGSPEFGELLFLSAEQTFFVSEETERGWRGRERDRTCKEFGTHVLDLSRFFFGEDPHALTARMPRGHPDGPDHLNLIQLEFSGGRMAQITLDRLSRGRHRYLTMRLDGSAGCVETHLGGGVELRMGIRGGSRRPFLSLDVSPGGWARLYHGEGFEKIASDGLDIFAEATRRLLRVFLDALDQGGAPACHAEDNRRTLALMLAAYESDRKGSRIELEY